jgi:two-component system phosphate regulon sensor histidine kinase PhoR
VFSRLLRHLLLPQLLVLIALAVALAIVAAVAEPRSAAIVWWTVSLALIATIVAGAIGYRAIRRHIRATAQLLTDAVPAAQPKQRSDDSFLVEDIADALAKIMAEAAKDQAQLLTIISSMSDGLIATDHQQRILLTNNAAADLMTFRSKEARGRQLWEIVPIEAVLKTVTEVSLIGQRKTISIGPVSGGKYLEVTIARLPTRPAGFIIVAHDVTETMRYEELRKEFVANVSHELRTPLTVIKGYVETLQDGALDDRQRAMNYLATVEKHTEQLTNLVDDLLSLSRLDSTTAVPSPRPVHLERVAAKVVELMMPAAQRKGQTLALNASEGLHPIVGNSEYLERAVSNLVENAIKYTRENGTVRVIVRAENAGQTNVVEVSDNGIGITAEDLPRIFERFFRSDRSRSREMGGTGLGLSIVKHIVQTHKGTIDVQSKPGEGSTFRMKFPIAADEESPSQPQRPAERSAEPDAGGAAA